MAKRRAAKQLTRDSVDSGSGSSDEGEDVRGVAAPSVLAQRKIAVPRSRISRPASNALTANSGTSKPAGSVFAAFASSSKPSSVPANPFSLLTSGNSKPAPAKHTSEQLDFRALNEVFVSKLNASYSAAPFNDFSSLCQKYVEYARGITSTAAPVAVPDIFKKKPEIKGPKKIDEPAETKEPSNKPVFSFGTAAQNLKEGKGFDANASTEPVKSLSGVDKSSAVFSFGKPSSEPAPVFKFGSSGASIADLKKSEDKKPDEAKVEETKPVESKPVSLFGVANANNTNPNAADSSVSSIHDTSVTTDTPEPTKPAFSFSFGKPKEPEQSTPGSTQQKPLFSFGKPLESKTGESQDGDIDESNDQGSAGSNEAGVSDKSTKPVFSFGKPASTPAAFSFGKPDQAQAQTQTQTQTDSTASTDAPKPIFSFGKAPAPGSFSFGSIPSSGSVFGKPGSTLESTPAAPAASSALAPSTSTLSAAAPDAGAETETPADQQVDLDGPGPGEEDEDNVYEKKSKVFELQDGAYKTLGLGFLRVLVHRDTKKARVLVRAEGSGRVLLNVALRKAITYSVVGKGQVKLIDVVEGSSEPKIYLLRVKTEEDGNNLKDKLEEVKN